MARLLARYPKIVIAFTLIVTAIFGVCARHVRLDNNFAALFSSNSQAMNFRAEYRKTWGADDGLLVAVVHVDHAPDKRTIDLVGTLTERPGRTMPELTRVDSVTNVPVLVPGRAGPVATPAFGPASKVDLPISQRVALARNSSLGAGDLVSSDGRTFLVVGELAAKYDSYETVVGPAQRFEKLVRALVRDSGTAATVEFSGVAFTRISAIHQMQFDLLLLSPLCTLLIVLILWVVFRRIAAVVANMAAIGCSTVVTAGIIGLNHDNLNQVTVIYPVLLMGVVVSSSAHLVHRFYRERANGLSATDAAEVLLGRVTKAMFVAALTSAIGFASLVIAKMQILHEFGVYLALGVMAAFLIQVALVPAILVVADSEPSDSYVRAASSGGSGGRTERYARWITQPKVALRTVASGVVLVIVSVLIASTARYDYSLSGMLKSGNPTARGNAVIDGELSGVIPVEVSLQGRPGMFRDPAVLIGMNRLAEWMQRSYGIRTSSVASLVRDASSAAGGPAAVPRDRATVRRILDAADGHGMALRTLVTKDYAWARLRGFSPDRGGNYFVELTRTIPQRAAIDLAGTGVVVQLTGEAPVGYAGINRLTRELVVSTWLAVGMIVLAIMFAFRSLRLALVGTLPNVVPVLVGLATYCLSADVLDPLPGIVFCIAMGLAADDTIQLINRWRELRPTTPSSREALVQALLTVRKAMVSSSMVLIAGFLALTLSGFAWNQLLGVLGSYVLLLALLGDLVFGTAGLALVAWRQDRKAAALAKVMVPPDRSPRGVLVD